MGFLDMLSRVLSDAAEGYQTWQHGIRPRLDEEAYLRSERAFQAEERRRIAQEREAERAERASVQRKQTAQSFAALAERITGDPNRAVQMFGQAYLDAVKEGWGVDLPTRQKQITEPGPVVAPAQDVTVGAPPTGMAGLEAPRPGQKLPPQTITIPEKRGPDVTKEVTELALPEGAQPAFKTVGDVAKALGRDLINPQMAGTPLESLPKNLDLDALFKPLPSPPKRVAVYDQTTGKWSTYEAPPGTELRIVSSPKPDQPVPIIAVDAQGNARVVGMAPPGSRIVQLPKPGGAGDSTETQARMKADLMRRYLAGENIGPRGERILFGTAGEEILPVRDRELLRLWRDNLDPIDGSFKDPALAERLKPDVDRIVAGLTTPQQAPPPSERAAAVLATWNTEKKPVPIQFWGKLTKAEQDWLKQQGVKYGGQPAEPAPKPAPKPAPPAQRPTGQIVTSEADLNRIVETAAKTGQPFPEAKLQRMGVAASIIASLRARYNALKQAKG